MDAHQHGGSSPRLRGTVLQPCRLDRQDRFIPAPAGNGRPSLLTALTRAVHPRACGERAREKWGARADAGSSPRLRGTAPRAGRLCPGLRFIPAPAGNGSDQHAVFEAASVHPRACGERRSSASALARTAGSSPRLRGTGLRKSTSERVGWFIPAPAGNGLPRRGERSHAAVHPRACGERVEFFQRLVGYAGSSPRLRGTAATRAYPPGIVRFIPAPAGNGFCVAACSSNSSVHPRACGERPLTVRQP